MISRAARNDRASAAGVTSSRLSADEWYSGKRPCGVRVNVPDREVEPRRAELPLVAAAGLPARDEAVGEAGEHEGGRTVDRRAALPASLVTEGPGSPTQETASPCRDAVERVEIAGQPAERAERPGLQRNRYV